ncbi:hypothetical protein SAMN05192558_101434 [Actinokineospora alba]|uniref:Uncharacterized protein n=1 Tax=Actinokineospora alba TaxID=504798 RepID=A0A1H0FMQ8_9PSEU|nr:hypothetical protein [Actinokineospora alba]TDP69539.1 hypothetical protein C8E96_5130 [Actinokineospora alba]SDI14653.1 hypothetical protein SAMN05421871_103437 [Actinokineospora alba]SDN95874.1 hypothetical protein SAMN05192558_101434 [Actinokineospora alba]
MFQHRVTTTTATRTPAVEPAGRVHDRYADLRDRRLAVALSTEDDTEADGLNPLDRMTCWTHRRWLHDCVSSPLHVIPVTGHRWCRDCSRPVDIAIDALTGDVRLRCPKCARTPDTAATRQLVRACRASLAAAADTGDDPWAAIDSLRRKPSRR